MKFILLFLLIAAQQWCIYSKVIRKWPWNVEYWMKMPLDHFNLFDNRTWNMRYFEYDHYFEEGKPLFIEIGGEWTVNGGTLRSGQLNLLAKKHRGFLVATEHRYYGKSLPFATDFSAENLKYLQIEQALEDLAYFIEHFKASNPKLKDSKVIVHGCSYAGMLATWTRVRFPHIVNIGYASSAPLGVALDFPEYFEAINDVYANVSVSCIDTIREGFDQAQKLLRTDDGEEVENALKEWSCGDIEEMEDAEILWTMMTVLNVQNDPVHYEKLGCLTLLTDKDKFSAFERLAKFVVMKSKDQGGCSSSRNTEHGRREELAWKYQTCTEVGVFQTLNRKNSKHPFSVDFTMEKSIEGCTGKFGKGVTEALVRTGLERVIRRYGGKNPKITKLLSVQGSNDPWKPLGKMESSDPEAPVIILNGSHCVDASERKDNPVELIEAQENIRNIISAWINEISEK